MSQELLGSATIGLIYLTAYLALLCVGGIIADYVLPNIPAVQRWLDSLPPYEDDYEREDVMNHVP